MTDDVLLDALLDLAFDPNQARDSRGRWTESAVRASITRITEKVEAFVRVDKGPDRETMPQLSGVPIPGSKADALPHAPGEEVDLTDQFEKELRARGVAVVDTELRVAVLKPTQDQIIEKKVEGIANYLMTNPPEDAPIWEPIFVTRDDFVVDGHHRWAARYVKDEVLNEDTAMKVRQIGLNKTDAMIAAINFMDEWGLPRAGLNDAGALVSAFAKKDLAFDLGDLIDLADYSSLAKPGYTGPRRTSDKERAIAHALMRKGKSKSQAIAMARGLLKKAARSGRWGDKGRAHASTVAAARASIAQRKTF